MEPWHFDYETKATLSVTNDTLEPIDGFVVATLCDSYSEPISRLTYPIHVEPLSVTHLEEIDYEKTDVRNNYLSYELVVDSEVISEGTVLFTAPKHFNFVDPELEVYLDGDEIVVKASAYAKSVEIYSPDSDFILSDNFFDMNAGEKRVKIVEGEVGEIRVRSVYDIK
jgi:beta-mannosidase